MNIFRSALLSAFALVVLSTACSKPGSGESSPRNKSNLVRNENTSVNELIGDEQVELHVLSRSEFKLQLLAGSILGTSSEEGLRVLNSLPQTRSLPKRRAQINTPALAVNEESLILGFPIDLIGEQSIFGGVITKVTDKKSEILGGLKLTDLSPLNVKTAVAMDGENPVLSLLGCFKDCDEDAPQSGLLSIPIVGIDKENNKVMLDLAAVGKVLNLLKMLDPAGKFTKLQSVSSTTTAVDYSLATLIFDVKSMMVPLDADPADPKTPVTEFTVRWYLKLSSAFNPAFTPREPTAGVGFFKTERARIPKITRFSTTDFGRPVKYYIKFVPEQYKSVFAAALENWNKEFTEILGRSLLSFEFIDAGDPRADEFVTGDIRYNIIEWDLNNVTVYGGLGPSVANQFTGEILSANVLVQGPAIVAQYTRWFELSKTIRRLLALGLTAEANELMVGFSREAALEQTRETFSLSLGDSLPMTIHSQRKELEDPMIKNHFEVVPAGVTFETYMVGFFTELIEHEVGHNLGLRHNFKGSLGASDSGSPGSVSRSIMDYVGRPFRYLNAIGPYDRMAISYGYKGVAPLNLNWFCSDDNQGSDRLTLALKSPECNQTDATSDPFSYLESRLARLVDLLVDVNSTSSPVWTAKELSTPMNEIFTGLIAYAASAEKTSSTWTNFFGKAGRPEDAPGLKAYVLTALKKKICAPELTVIIASKETPEAVKLAGENLETLRAFFLKKSVDNLVFTADEVKCE